MEKHSNTLCSLGEICSIILVFSCWLDKDYHHMAWFLVFTLLFSIKTELVDIYNMLAEKEDNKENREE